MLHANSIESLSTAADSTIVGGYADDRSALSISPSNVSLAKTFRTIRKHLTWTSNKNLPQMTTDDHSLLATYPISPSTSPSDRSLLAWENQNELFPSRNPSPHGTSYVLDGGNNERFPKGIVAYPTDLHQQTMKSQHSISTSYTSYQTRSFTIHTHSGAIRSFGRSVRSMFVAHVVCQRNEMSEWMIWTLDSRMHENFFSIRLKWNHLPVHYPLLASLTTFDSSDANRETFASIWIGCSDTDL